MKYLVIYHGSGCLDGFGAALAAHVYFQQQTDSVEYLAGKHGDTSDLDQMDLSNTTLYLVDFAYPRSVMSNLCERAAQVIVLDHHVSAEADLKGLEQEYENLQLQFDMHRSGAVLTWDYFHSQPAPLLLQCIQDRDLWQFQVEDSSHINAALMSLPYDFDAWQTLLFNEDQLKQLIPEGKAINRFRQKMIDHHERKAAMGVIAGYEVPVVNCPREIISELVGSLSKGYPFAAGYSDQGTHRSWSLRSTAKGIDVSLIASQFGGGGHPRAAGFSTDIPESLIELPTPTL